MGLFDSIRRVVGGGDTGDVDEADDDAVTQPDIVDTHELDEATLRERAASVAGEVEVLDFSLDSLAQFDDAIDAGYDEELATSDTPGAYATDTVRFGCYLGEVLVRVYDGEWTRNPDWGVTITGPDGTTTVAVFDVAERSILTGAVFAAVADRAAVEVGLDGVSADSDAESSAADGDPEPDEDTAEANSEPDEDTDVAAADGDDSDEDAAPTAGDETTDETAADAGVFGAPDESTADPDPSVDDQPVDGPGDDGQPVDVSDGDGLTADRRRDEGQPADEPTADDTTDASDPVTADASPSETDQVVDDSDTDSLIEEAEPAPAADDGSTPAAGTAGTEPAAEESGGPERAGEQETAPTDSSESLFGDTAAETGPTVDDAPSAEDGPLTPPSESDGAPDSADRDGGTAAEAESGGDGSDSGAGAAEASDPMAGDGLRATYAEAADELVSFWTEYDLDYTPDSLERLDELVSEEWDDDRFDDADFGSDDSFDDRVFTSVSTELGSYFGEVLIRELDAEWSDETATDGVVVDGAEGPLAIPVFKVAGTSITQQPVFARSYDSLLSDIEG